MGELGIILAILFGWGPWIMINVLFFGTVVVGVAVAGGL